MSTWYSQNKQYASNMSTQILGKIKQFEYWAISTILLIFQNECILYLQQCISRTNFWMSIKSQSFAIILLPQSFVNKNSSYERK